MEKLQLLRGIAATLPRDNVDTDAIIPSRETQSVSRAGYGEKLFSNWRYQPGTRIEIPDFVLNRPPFREAVILLSGRNFGCGSSREAATWALRQFGIRCVIAESFGAIFRNNCVRNGILPVELDAAAKQALLDELQAADPPELSVDLEACKVRSPAGRETPFAIDALDRQMLLEGLDEIELTLKQSDKIAAYRQRDALAHPWIYETGRKQAGSGA